MDKLKRYLIFLVGLFINSLGVSFVTKASLGTSPISSIPYVLSLNFPFTLGEFTIFFSILLIVLQLVILRKNFKLEHILQIPISIVFGYFIDLTMVLLNGLNPQHYAIKILCLLAGCLILGFGVYLEVLADVAMLPGESFVRAVVFTWKTEFGTTKIIFDVSMAVIACILSFVLSHSLEGVREGTIIAALLVGYIARVLGRVLAPLKVRLFGEEEDAASADREAVSSSPIVITIGREYGSGGHDIGQQLAKKLGYAFYDKDIIRLAAGTTGYSEDFIEQKEESMTNSLLYDLVNQVYSYTAEYAAPKDNLFYAESDVIRSLAQKESCVIVGRCADYVLRENKNCIRFFLHAPLSYRIGRIMRTEGLSEKDAKAKILKIDRLRAGNYRYYTNQSWGYSGGYHLSIDTSYGEEYILEQLEGFVKKGMA
jgi:uncharacterized membrane protein YczE